MKRKNIGRLAAVALSAVLLSGNMGQSYAMNVEEVPEKEETDREKQGEIREK